MNTTEDFGGYFTKIEKERENKIMNSSAIKITQQHSSIDNKVKVQPAEEKTKEQIELELLENIMERFVGVHPEYYRGILEGMVNDIKNPGM